MALRCLIVDDNAEFVIAVSDLLAREGLAVVGSASSGHEAVERTRELRPDVTLLDIDLGGESGFDVARALAGDALASPARIILISAHAEADYVEMIEASPAVGFVAKTELSAESIRAVLQRTS